ncbi:MAG: hypothetical protein ISS34_04015 [Candidatus Omnitrophica bacterium]|nr:hypothetical protein [Candidatus Omnitrophota bacterium]
MKRKEILVILLIGFICGILFVGSSAVVVKKGMPIIVKIKQKLKQRYIANIPKAKRPLIISDFESKREIEKWDFKAVEAHLSRDHVTEGKSSLRLIYKPLKGAASARIENYFDKNRRLRNWAQYELLAFDIFNPSNASERMILQIKDIKEYKVKHDIYLKPNRNNTIEIDIRGLWDKINVAKIDQFNLFIWNNESEKEFYLDNLRLLPQASMGKRGIDITKDEFLPKKGEVIYKTGDYFAFDKTKWNKGAPIIINNYLPVQFKDFTFSGGVPFGFGELKNLDNAILLDRAGNEIPFQARVLSRWPDKSIKWALIDMKTTVDATDRPLYWFKYKEETKKRKQNSRLTVKESRSEVIVNTGPMRFIVNKKNFYPFEKIWMDKNRDGKFDRGEIISEKGDMVLVHRGREYFSSLDPNYELKIEEEGPLKISLKAKGWFTSKRGKKFCQFIVRIYAKEGSSSIKMQHTFVYTGYPENKYHYLYKGKRLPKNETIDAIYITTPIDVKGPWQVSFVADDKLMQSDLKKTVDLYQSGSKRYSVKEDNRSVHEGGRMQGWVDISGTNEGVSLGIKNFWQQFPKMFSIDKEARQLITYIWPKEAGELDFKTTQAAEGPNAVARGSAFGIAKTHELFYHFHNGDFSNSDAKDAVITLAADIFVTPHPKWTAATKVLGKVREYDNRIKPAEEFLERIFNWSLRQCDAFDWYGMIDFGDTLSWYRKDGYDKSYSDWGWHPEGRWGWFNCEAVGTHTGALVQFLRTGDYKYFYFGGNLSRHMMDIDTCHYNTVANDRRLKKRIPDDYSRIGSMHRHNGDHWGGRNEEASHTNVYGLALYYYVTGDLRAKDVIEEIGQFFLSEPMTYYGHPDISPQRTIANVFWGDLLLYEITQESRYKKAADKWAELFYIGQKGNGAWAESYNPVKRQWEGKPCKSFMEDYTLPALIAYHQLTGNKAIASCIIDGTDFVIETEGYAAYFDSSAYCYWLTGDTKYLENIRKRLDFTIGHQNRNGDPLWDGMIYQKGYYSRPMEYLYKVPFAFEALAEGGS